LIVVYVLAWFFVLLLLGLWSLAAWGLHALAQWTVSQAGDGALGTVGLGGLQLPEQLLVWLPPQAVEALNAMLASLGPLVHSLLQSMPALAGVLTLASWVVWGLGVTMLLLLGAGVHLLLALWRRRGGSSPPPGGQALAAG
jgi:hypothetical protein